MVKAMIDISEKANQVLNIVKARENFHDKSEAIDFVVVHYGLKLLEPELKPNYIKKLELLEKEKGVPFKSIAELRKRLER